MTTQIQADLTSLDDYKTHVAQTVLDFSVDTNFRVLFANALYGGSVIFHPRYVTVDNLANPSPVTLTLNGIDTTILPFERTEKLLSGEPGYLDFSGNFGKCTVQVTDAPFSQKANADNLYGNIYPVVDTFTTYTSANSFTVAFDFGSNAQIGSVAIICSDVSISAPPTANSSYYHMFENGFFGNNLIADESYAAATRRFYVGWCRLKSYDAGNPLNQYSFTSGGLAASNPRAHVLILANAQKEEGSPIDTVRTLNRTTTVAAEQVLAPSHNLTGLKRLGIMIAGNSIAGTFSGQQMGGANFTERYDAHNTMIATGNLDKAGTTDNPKYTVSSAVGTVSKSIIMTVK